MADVKVFVIYGMNNTTLESGQSYLFAQIPLHQSVLTLV